MGGSSPGDGGAAERKAAEEARVQKAVGRVNDMFGIYTPNQPINAQNGKLVNRLKGVIPEKQRKANAEAVRAGRESLYQTMATDAQNMAMLDLNREKEQIDRENKFALARQGLTGGSRDVDSNRLIEDRYNQGILQAGNAASTVANNARSSDEKTRVNLINSIRAGLDKGSAVQMAYQGMNNNINDARNAALATNMAGFFSALQPAINNYAYQQDYANAMNGLEKGVATPGSAVGKGINKGGYGGSQQGY